MSCPVALCRNVEFPVCGGNVREVTALFPSGDHERATTEVEPVLVKEVPASFVAVTTNE
jgi:hypothetical protein